MSYNIPSCSAKSDDTYCRSDYIKTVFIEITNKYITYTYLRINSSHCGHHAATGDSKYLGELSRFVFLTSFLSASWGGIDELINEPILGAYMMILMILHISHTAALGYQIILPTGDFKRIGHLNRLTVLTHWPWDTWHVSCNIVFI